MTVPLYLKMSERKLNKDRERIRRRIAEHKVNNPDTLPDDIHLAFCGKCYYTDEMKEFHERNCYPFCACVFGHDYEIIKCKDGEPDESGRPIDGGILYYGRVEPTFTECPPGHKLRAIPVYDIIIFADPNSVPEHKKFDFVNRHHRNMIRRFNSEIERLKRMYPTTISYIMNTFNFNTLIRWGAVKTVEDAIDAIERNDVKRFLEKAVEDAKYLKTKVEEADRLREEMHRKADEQFRRNAQEHSSQGHSSQEQSNSSSVIIDAYRVLGFKDISNPPSHRELKANYKKMSLKFHPDKNDIDTTALFLSINNAYQAICEHMGYE